jgi:hypothetical protein
VSATQQQRQELNAMAFLFKVNVLLYTVAPVVLIPCWAYYEDNWWLLFGIPVSYMGSLSAAFRAKLVILFSLLCVGVWLGVGFSIHQYITFFFFCAWWGAIFFRWANELLQMAEETRKKTANQSASENPEIAEAR